MKKLVISSNDILADKEVNEKLIMYLALISSFDQKTGRFYVLKKDVGNFSLSERIKKFYADNNIDLKARKRAERAPSAETAKKSLAKLIDYYCIFDIDYILIEDNLQLAYFFKEEECELVEESICKELLLGCKKNLIKTYLFLYKKMKTTKGYTVTVTINEILSALGYSLYHGSTATILPDVIEHLVDYGFIKGYYEERPMTLKGKSEDVMCKVLVLERVYKDRRTKETTVRYGQSEIKEDYSELLEIIDTYGVEELRYALEVYEEQQRTI